MPLIATLLQSSSVLSRRRSRPPPGGKGLSGRSPCFRSRARRRARPIIMAATTINEVAITVCKICENWFIGPPSQRARD